jgi:hypothetical protein
MGEGRHAAGPPSAAFGGSARSRCRRVTPTSWLPAILGRLAQVRGCRGPCPGRCRGQRRPHRSISTHRPPPTAPADRRPPSPPGRAGASGESVEPRWAGAVGRGRPGPSWRGQVRSEPASTACGRQGPPPVTPRANPSLGDGGRWTGRRDQALVEGRAADRSPAEAAGVRSASPAASEECPGTGSGSEPDRTSPECACWERWPAGQGGRPARTASPRRRPSMRRGGRDHE